MIGKHKTKIVKDGNEITVTYHQTAVVIVTKKWVTLNSGGHTTATTKKRMNQVSETYHLGFYVYQQQFKWVVRYKGLDLEFFDGIVLER